MRDITKTAVERQLKGMKLDRLEVLITGGDRPNVRAMTQTEIIEDLPRLKRANKSGYNIYIRGPRDQHHDLILIDDIDAAKRKRMEDDDLKPAVVVETSPGNFQAWLRIGEPVPVKLRRHMAKILAKRYGGDVAAADGHQAGRLAGFTNPKPEHKKNGLSPFVVLKSFAGKEVKAAHDLLEEARIALEISEAEKEVALALIPSPDADANLVDWWRRGHLTAQSDDLSSVDWYLTNFALGCGRTPEDVAAALEEVADRKGKHAHDYAVLTVSNASSKRELYNSPTI